MADKESYQTFDPGEVTEQAQQTEKKSTNKWIWIVVAIGGAILIYFFFFRKKR